MHSIRDLDELQAHILDLIFEVAPAERGAILLDGTTGREFNSVFGRNRDLSNGRPVRVSTHSSRTVFLPRASPFSVMTLPPVLA